MRQAIRALGWATTALWIFVLIFMGTVFYSLANLGVEVGQSEAFPSNEGLTMSLPLLINNTGYYDISELNLTTYVTDCNRTLVSASTTYVPSISSGISIERAHNISISLNEFVPKNLTYLFFNDSVLNVDTFMILKFAQTIYFQMSTNTTMLWGAPLYNFSINEISCNLTDRTLTVPIEFENHSPFDINGTIRLDVYDDENEQIGYGEATVSATSHSGYEDQIELFVNLSKRTKRGQVHLFIETAMFSLGPIVKEWVAPND